MNIKFSDDALNLKITEAELERLHSGQRVETDVTIAGQHIMFHIVPSALCETDQAEYSAGEDKATLTFYIPDSAIETLADMGRSKHGLKLREHDPEITLQVDIRSDSREKAITR